MSLNLGLEYLENTHKVRCPAFQNQPHRGLEAMTGYSDVPGSSRGVTALRRRYMRALGKYNSLEKQIQEATMRNQIRQTELRAYLGKRSLQPDGEIVYVNDYGFTAAYVDSASPTSPTCNAQPIPITDEKMQFLRASGSTVSSAMPCGLAGKNVQNENTLETAWVDVKGKKHVYSKAIWSSKQATCNVVPVLLSPGEYNALPEGSAMQSTSECVAADIEPGLWAAKQKALARLLQITQEVEGRTNELQAQEAKVAKVTQATRALRMRIDKGQSGTKQVTEPTQLILVSNHLHLLVWTMICFTMFAVVLHAVLLGTGKLGDAVVLAIVLIAIYIATRSLWWWAAI